VTGNRPFSVSASLQQHGARLRAESLRLPAVALAAGLWITAAYTLSTPGLFDRNGTLKGVDFLQFHTAAHMVASGEGAQLYDWDAFAARLTSLIPGTGDLLFLSVYPPQLAVGLAPLGRLPYGWALAAWTLVTILLYAICVRVIARQFPAASPHLPWWLLALAFVPFQQLLAHGQASILVLVCLTGAWLSLRRERWGLFGFFLGSLFFKPSFLVAPAAAIVVAPRPLVLAGVAFGAAAQLALVSLALGPGVWTAYAGKAVVLLTTPELFEPKPWQMHSLKGFWQLLLGTNAASFALWVVSSLAVLALFAYVWRRARSSDLRMGALVIAAVLMNPHLYVYDLVALAVAFGALVRWALDAPRSGSSRQTLALLYLLWWVPLIGPLAALTRVQLTSIVLAGLMAALLAAVRTRADAPARSTADLRSA